jgi:VanZ family protein
MRPIFFHGIFLPWMRRAGAWLFWPALAVVAWGELTPHAPPLPGPLQWDKAEHFTAYLGLALLALGGALEIIQNMVGRDGEWGDFAANSLGALLGLAMAVAYLMIPRRLVEAPRRD